MSGESVGSLRALSRRLRLPTVDRRLLTLSTLLACVLLLPASTSAALTESARLAAIYDSILSAQFDRASAQLKEACPPAPAEACTTLEVVSLWWQININPESRLLDQRLNDAATAAIRANEAWTRREPNHAEAWFYLAGAYAPLVQWRILRGERIGAARDGSRIKTALERALKLDPALGDAYFGIGLYHYYADVAPTYAKVLRWLLALPGGDRLKGLREMTTAREHGELLTGEADYQLHLLYLWYENRSRDALHLLASLDARYPTNPLFLERIARVQDVYFHDPHASAAAWSELLARALAKQVYAPAIAETRARLGLASMLIATDDVESAAAHLQKVIDENPIAPPGARATAVAMMRTVHSKRKF